MPPSKKIRTILTAVIVIAGIYILYKNIHQLSELKQQLNFMWLIVATCLAMLAILLSAYKLKLTVDITLNKTVFFNNWAQVFIKSYILNNVIPYSGIAYRGIHLKKYYGISYTQYVGVCYIFGMVGLILILGSAGLALSIAQEAIGYAIITALIFLLFRYKFYFLKKVASSKTKNKIINFYLEKLGILENYLNIIYLSRKLHIFLVVFLSSLCIDFLVFSTIFLSIQPEVSWNLMIYVYIPYSLAWLIRITPGNIGIQEILIGGVTTIVGLGVISGITLSILLRLINLGAAFLVWSLISIKTKNETPI